MRFARLGALALAGATLACQTPAHAAQPASGVNQDDGLLLELRLGPYRIGDGVRGYAVGGGSCLIFADIIQSLDVPIALDAAGSKANGWAFDEKQRLAIDRRAASVSVRGTASRLAPGDIIDAPEGWCVETSVLSAWFGATFSVDASNAILFVKSPKKLPLELAAERKARAAAVRPAVTASLAGLPQIRLPYRAFRAPALDTVVTFGGVREPGRGTRLERRYELFASGEMAKMSVDARLASDRDGMPSALRMRAYRTDPGGKLLGPLGATHFAVGDVAGFGTALVATAFAGRGAVLTNRPVDRPDSFDRTSFRGELPSGWDAELYRNGQLLAFAASRSDGRYEFLDVPLLYGGNEFEVILYGPQGQVRRQAERVQVGIESIPRGKSHYWAGISQDERDLVSLARALPFGPRRGWRAAFGLEHGLDTRTSVAAGVQSLVIDDRRLTYMEGSVRRAVGPALVEVSLAYEQAGGMAARAQMLAQLGDTYVSAESVGARGGFVSNRVDADVTGRHALSIDHSFKLGQSQFPAHIETRYVTRALGADSLEAAARLSANFQGFSLTGGVDWQRQRTSGPDPPSRLGASILGNGRIGRVRLRGEARWLLSGADAGFEGATLVGEYGDANRALWRGELGYDGARTRARAALGYSRQFSAFALSLTGEAASDGALAAGANIAFSLGSGLKNPFRASSLKIASAGSLEARVFRDLNNDGQRQPGEPGAEGVQITAGTSVIDGQTDKEGRVIVDGLQPFRPISIGVDTTTLTDPLIQPRYPGQVLTPRPGITASIDIPLVGAGEVEGTLASASGRPIEGVELELVNSEGRVVAAQASEFDGFFLFERVPYGSYTLRAKTASAAAVGIVPALAEGVTLAEGATVAKLGTIRAVPTR